MAGDLIEIERGKFEELEKRFSRDPGSVDWVALLRESGSLNRRSKNAQNFGEGYTCFLLSREYYDLAKSVYIHHTGRPVCCFDLKYFE